MSASLYRTELHGHWKSYGTTCSRPCTDAVAVGTNYVTFRNLIEDALPRVAVDHIGDVADLLFIITMIKFEYDYVVIPTINTGTICQILTKADLIAGTPLDLLSILLRLVTPRVVVVVIVIPLTR
jgi:hypothetical protein